MKDNIKKAINNKFVRIIIIVAILLLSLLVSFIIYQNEKYIQVSENDYNQSLYELINYVQNVETYLAKSVISTTPEHGAETLKNVWREANLAQAYLAELPVNTNELEKTEKFLNQVSDYSYSLSRKNIYNESLTQEELDNLNELYNYSVELENTLAQLSTDMESGRISWKQLTQKTNNAFAQQVSNISLDSFSNLEENFHEYSGLIYDGAFSEHLTSKEKKGLTGEEVSEEDAKKVVENFVGAENIKEISLNGESENTEILTYDFSVNLQDGRDDNKMSISISKKGGHIVYMSYNRDINAESMNEEEAVAKAKEFLVSREIENMKETYYIKEGGMLTINFAYEQNGVIIYPDLIKIKIALDNGQIMGMETSGYLNSHYVRNIENPKITLEEAKKTLNKKLEVESEKLAIIPTEYQTEILCYEFKGKVNDKNYIVYINAENGREEDILLIVDTGKGTLTM